MGVRRAIRRLRRVLFGTRTKTEIEMVTAALRRHEAAIDEMSSQWRPGDCCPSCMFGHRYTEAADQARRTRAWLIHLLRRRGLPEDAPTIRGLEWDNT